MHVEVDQSGKIEQTRWDTVLAFSDDTDCAILIPAKVKREAIVRLRASGKRGRSAYLFLFARGLYLLLRDHLEALHLVTIDTEYQGNEADIKAYLLRLIWRVSPGFEADRIGFRPIGKKSPAHAKAIAVYRGEKEADRRISLEELLGW